MSMFNIWIKQLLTEDFKRTAVVFLSTFVFISCEGRIQSGWQPVTTNSGFYRKRCLHHVPTKFGLNWITCVWLVSHLDTCPGVWHQSAPASCKTPPGPDRDCCRSCRRWHTQGSRCGHYSRCYIYTCRGRKRAVGRWLKQEVETSCAAWHFVTPTTRPLSLHHTLHRICRCCTWWISCPHQSPSPHRLLERERWSETPCLIFRF